MAEVNAGVMTYRGNQVDDESWQWRLASGPVGSPEAVAEGKGYAFFC